MAQSPDVHALFQERIREEVSRALAPYFADLDKLLLLLDVVAPPGPPPEPQFTRLKPYMPRPRGPRVPRPAEAALAPAQPVPPVLRRKGAEAEAPPPAVLGAETASEAPAELKLPEPTLHDLKEAMVRNLLAGLGKG